MKIKMLKTRQGSPDGISVVTYCADDVIDIPAGLLPTANEVIKRLQDIRTRVRYHD